MCIQFAEEFCLRELLNYRHPGPRRASKGGSEQHLLAPLQLARVARGLVWPGLAWVGLVCPRMVLGHNLHHMARFPVSRTGLGMVFRRAHFILLVPETRFWTRGPFFGPGISKFGPGLARDILGVRMGPRKTWLCLGNGSKIQDMGNPVTQMDCMVSWRCLGELVCPQALPKKCFQGIPRFSGILGVALGRPVYPLLALCGLLALCDPRSTDEGGLYVNYSSASVPLMLISFTIPRC